MAQRDWLGRDVSGGKGNDFSGAGYDKPRTSMNTNLGTNIQRFSAEMSKVGFARPNTFRVEVSHTALPWQPRFTMSCFQAQIPGNVIATTEKDIGFRSVAYQRVFSDIILGFYAGDDLRELMFWQDWIDDIVDKNTNHFNYYNQYIGTVTIYKIDRQGRDVAWWKLHDAYPKQVDPIQLDYGTNDAITTVNTTITYRYFEHKYLERPGGQNGQDNHNFDGIEVEKQKSDYINYNQKMNQRIDSFKELREQLLGDRTYDASKDPTAGQPGVARKHSNGSESTREGNSMTGGAFNTTVEV